mmetsp:Transcript_13560/g.19151  ORF Transcript_13560/g.19151 Transcript_13560/m.19151 type:complete len:264 (-) Transcript_13560:89-880(-)
MTLVSSTLRVCLGNVDNTNLPSTDTRVISMESLSSPIPTGTEGDVAPSSIDSLEVYVLVNELTTVYDPMSLSDWIPKLKANASVSIHAVVDGEDDDKKIDLQPVHTSFLLAGLVGASEQKSPKGRIVTAARKVKESTAAILPPRKKNIVTLSLDDDNYGNEDDLIDEDGLLDDELAPPPALLAEGKNAADDCGGRKACDNCTCGRAELEAGAVDAPKEKSVPTSSCGNCAKGDAFRCASCPYLGKPAFKPGEEHLVLDLTDDL